MTIHAYYGDYSQHKNEQIMFNDLLCQLKLNWQYSDDWIYVFYNTMWSGQEVDAIAFTRHAIIVIDLKNYSGSLTGAENGEWLIDASTPVLGGSQINPFVQIRKNKFAVLEWFKAQGIFTSQNLGFISGCIIFNELHSRNIELSNNVKKWFYVTDIPHAADALMNISSSGISLAEDDIEYLIGRLKLKRHDWDQTQTPRDIRYPLADEAVASSLSAANQSRPSIALKHSLSRQAERELPSFSSAYLAFFATVGIALFIAFNIASGMQGSGQGPFYILKLFFG